jgi:hypothetical protein
MAAKLVSMKMTRAERDKKYMEVANMPSKDAVVYPYGLCIRLDNDAIEKLGLEELPKVGTYLYVTANVEVTSVSQNESETGENKNIELQITDMALTAPSGKKDDEVLFKG